MKSFLGNIILPILVARKIEIAIAIKSTRLAYKRKCVRLAAMAFKVGGREEERFIF